MANIRAVVSLEPRISPAAAAKVRSQLAEMTSGGKILQGLAGGAGLNILPQLVGAAGIVGMATAVGAILKQSVTMALQLDRTAMNVTQTLDLGGANILRNYNAFRQAALTAGQAAGYGPQTMQQAMAQYGLTSGATIGRVTAGASSIATLARAFGMEPAQLSTVLGTLAPYSGGTPMQDMTKIGGGALLSGDAGRRLNEFIGIATTTLVQLQGNMGGAATLDQALRLQTFVTGARDSYFRTPVGETAGIQGLMGLVTGNATNVGWAALAGRAGISMLDILSGSPGANNKNIFAILNELKKEYAQGPEGPLLTMGALTSKLGQQQGAVLFNMLEPLFQRPGPITQGNLPRGMTSDIATKFKEAMDGPFGQVQEAMAKLETAETDLGENVLVNQVLPAMRALTEALQSGNIVKALGDLTFTEKSLLGLLAVEAVKTLFPGAMSKVLPWGARLIGQGFSRLFGSDVLGALAGTDLGTALGIGGSIAGGMLGGAAIMEGVHLAVGNLVENSAQTIPYAQNKIMPNAPWLAQPEAIALAGGIGLPNQVPFHNELMAASKATGVPVALLAAYMMHESGGNPLNTNVNANGTTDYGLMQINSGYYGAFTGNAKLWQDPASNIMFGARIIAKHIFAEGGKTQAGQWQGLKRAIEDYNPGDPNYWRLIIQALDQIITEEIPTSMTGVTSGASSDQLPTGSSSVKVTGGTLKVQATFHPDHKTVRKPSIGRSKLYSMGHR
jgi:hypothetical protein